MHVTRDTKVHDLIEAHPYLLDFLADLTPVFSKLHNPVLYNTVARAASLATVAEMGDMSVEDLLDAVNSEIALHAIHGATPAADAPPVDPAMRTARQEHLKAIIHKLHDGASVQDVKAEFDALTQEIDAAEIAAMEQALIAEGMPVEEVQRLCDVHVTVFKDALGQEPAEKEPALQRGHPVATYERENAALGGVVNDVRRAAESLMTDDEGERASALTAIREALGRLTLLDIHYLRKENQLFPVLEAHDIEGPTQVMWALHDDIRARIKQLVAAADAGDVGYLVSDIPEVLGMVEDMVYKEEKILFPTALEALSEAEWKSMAAGEAEIGFAWIQPPTPMAAAALAQPGEGAEDAALLPLTTGALSLEQIDLMVGALPFDISFVDEHDRVRFYSEGDRIFPRSPAAIGREVRNCHPPKSVDKVEEILSEFKAGKKDVAEFWIEMSGRFIHIRYFAMRDRHGAYRGSLEVVQDATHVRQLEGQRRLVQW
ncbi:MAG: DUF438 domain-containing protein [Coriobacteriia bacterium]|jgi:DUF438 domain-containing protein|nr:DUF438 domain-containing protein [Coriobacteriia bacterium]